MGKKGRGRARLNACAAAPPRRARTLGAQHGVDSANRARTRAPRLTRVRRYTDALGLEWQAVHEETASVVGYELEWARATQASAHGAWQRACTVGDVDGELGPFALHAPRTSAALNELRDALRAPRCTASALPQHARLLVRARTRSLAGWGPWSAPTSAQTLDVKPCGALADQARIWGAAFNNELQTCSADCWGQVRALRRSCPRARARARGAPAHLAPSPVPRARAGRRRAAAVHGALSAGHQPLRPVRALLWRGRLVHEDGLPQRVRLEPDERWLPRVRCAQLLAESQLVRGQRHPRRCALMSAVRVGTSHALTPIRV